MFTRIQGFAIGAFALAIVATSAMAQPSAIEVPLHKSVLIPMDREVSRISVGQPAIADILITNSRQLYVLGKSLGTTNVVLWDTNDRSFASFDVSVVHDLKSLKEKLYRLFPNERPEVFSSQEALVLSGEISSLAKMDAIARVADSFIPKDEDGEGDEKSAGEVINLMQVGGVQQVMLEVKVAELARTVARRLGVNLLAIRPGTEEFRIGVVNRGASFPPVDELTLNPGTPDEITIENPTFHIPGEPVGPPLEEVVPNVPVIDGPGLFFSFLDPTFFLRAVIDAAKEEGLAKILAEPTLVTLTGQEAQFLSGGEFPIPVATGDAGTISVVFKEFGIGLRFLPVVLDSGRISLKVNVSVSELVTEQSVVVGVPTTTSAFAIPALTKRSTQSTVELHDGESLAIAGLISEDLRDVVTKFPGLGDVPVLGQLFRSQEFQQDKTELVIFVTANLATPTTPDQIRLPTDALVVPSDIEYYLLGRNVGKHITKEEHMRAAASAAGTQAMEFGHDVSGTQE